MSSVTASPRITILRFLPALAWAGVIFYISDQPTLPDVPGLASTITSVLGHFTVYFVLAVLIWWGLGARGLTDRQRVGIAFTIAVLYGVSDEWHQSFVPGRQPDIFDIITDAVGAATGLAIIQRVASSERFGHLIPK